MAVTRADKQAELEMLEGVFKGADLTADGRLAHMQRVAGVREASRLGSGVEDPQFVPVHRHPFKLSHTLA